MIDIQPRSTLLSAHFSLGELTHTAHANIDNSPSDEIVYQLQLLCTRYLEPLRTQFGPLWVSSGYRCPKLNALIGGVPDSAHIFGCAADLVPMASGVTVTQMVAWLATSGLDYDQIIDEGAGEVAWCHIGMLRPGFETAPRRECLTYRNGLYTPFQQPTQGA